MKAGHYFLALINFFSGTVIKTMEQPPRLAITAKQTIGTDCYKTVATLENHGMPIATFKHVLYGCNIHNNFNLYHKAKNQSVYTCQVGTLISNSEDITKHNALARIIAYSLQSLQELHLKNNTCPYYNKLCINIFLKPLPSIQNLLCGFLALEPVKQCHLFDADLQIYDASNNNNLFHVYSLETATLDQANALLKNFLLPASCIRLEQVGLCAVPYAPHISQATHCMIKLLLSKQENSSRSTRKRSQEQENK